MEDTKPTATMTREHESEPLPAELVDEASQEIVLAQRAETSLMARLTNMENGAAIFKRRADLLETCYLIAIGRTRPEDWVITKLPDGSISAMLKASGADLVAEVYGIQTLNLRPVDENGMFEPVRIDFKSGAYALRGAIDAFSGVNGRHIRNLEATRRSDEDFTGRSVDAEEKLTFNKDSKVGALDSDLRGSVLTLLRTKAVRVLCSMTRVPASDLERAWAKDPKKTLDKCTHGHGFGTSDSRRAGGVAEGDVAKALEELKAEVLRRVGGDTNAARKLTVDITKNEEKGFKGFDSLDRLTKDWQVAIARKALAAHPVFGDAKAGTAEKSAKGEKSAAREPGDE